MVTVALVPTAGEILWTWRKRHRLSVTTAAKRLSLTRAHYVEAEHDRCSFTDISNVLLTPTVSELLRLRRRRSLVARDDVARCLGVSHVTFIRWERSADPRVISFWFDQIITDGQPVEL